MPPERLPQDCTKQRAETGGLVHFYTENDHEGPRPSCRRALTV
jgi:hypothetical protein